MNVARAILPTMRQQKSGKVISISSTAGLVGYEFCTAYSASKFGLDGWTEALQAEVGPFGVQTMIVNPGFFRTELLTPGSTQFAELSTTDYAERRAAQETFCKAQTERKTAIPRNWRKHWSRLSAKLNCHDVFSQVPTPLRLPNRKSQRCRRKLTHIAPCRVHWLSTPDVRFFYRSNRERIFRAADPRRRSRSDCGFIVIYLRAGRACNWSDC